MADAFNAFIVGKTAGDLVDALVSAARVHPDVYDHPFNLGQLPEHLVQCSVQFSDRHRLSGNYPPIFLSKPAASLHLEENSKSDTPLSCSSTFLSPLNCLRN